MNVQAGVFVTRRVGLLASLGLAGASAAGGTGSSPDTPSRWSCRPSRWTPGRFIWASSVTAAWR